MLWRFLETEIPRDGGEAVTWGRGGTGRVTGRVSVRKVESSGGERAPGAHPGSTLSTPELGTQQGFHRWSLSHASTAPLKQRKLK